MFREAVRCQIFKYRFNIERLDPARYHRQAYAFAEPGVGDGEGGRLLDGCVAQRQGFDVRRMDIAAAADDDILLAAGDAQIALIVEPAEIAGHEPARFVERRLGRHLVVEIAEHQAGAAATDLADLAWRDGDIGIVLAPDADFVARTGPAGGLDDLPGRVVG